MGLVESRWLGRVVELLWAGIVVIATRCIGDLFRDFVSIVPAMVRGALRFAPTKEELRTCCIDVSFHVCCGCGWVLTVLKLREVGRRGN